VAYAALGDVQARAGALSGAWTANSKPSTGDITTFLDDVAAEIDAALAGRGLAITDPASPAGKALKNVNALGALVLALQATYPEGSGPSSASKAIDDARGEFDGLMASIMDGTHPAVRSLEAGTATTRATSFWEQEPYYGEFPFDPRLDPLSPDANPNTAPAFARGQSL
jgi:hypothetical protein